MAKQTFDFELHEHLSWLTAPGSPERVEALVGCGLDDGQTDNEWLIVEANDKAVTVRAHESKSVLKLRSLRDAVVEVSEAHDPHKYNILVETQPNLSPELAAAWTGCEEAGFDPKGLGATEWVLRLAALSDALDDDCVLQDQEARDVHQRLKATGQFRPAAKFFSRAREVAEDAGDISLLLRLFEAWHLRKSRSLRRAIAATDVVMEPAIRNRNHSPLVSAVLVQRGSCFADIGDIREARSCANMANAIHQTDHVRALYVRLKKENG